MKCRYCNTVLAPLRSLTDGEFCSDEHRQTFYEEQDARAQASANEATLEDPAAVPAPAAVPVMDELLPLHFEGHPAGPSLAGPGQLEDEAPFPGGPVLPDSGGEQLVSTVETAAAEPAQVSYHKSFSVAASGRWLSAAWKNAPSDLKIITLLLPILLAVAVGPSVPKIPIPRVKPTGVQQMISQHWTNLQRTIVNRAAVAFADDFRSGLDAWDSRSNLTTSWSYDATGFVRPGPLALFKPTLELSDYRFEFLGEIEQKGMGCVFRAANVDNYYAMRLVVAKPGPLPLVHLVRYAVIDGKEGPHVDKLLPITARPDMLYRILLDVRGSDFTILTQGQIVDFWSDTRLPRGGVGFFCGRGERARLRWVEVSHQYDTLGRLCAYLAPYGIEGRNGSWN